MMKLFRRFRSKINATTIIGLGSALTCILVIGIETFLIESRLSAIYSQGGNIHSFLAELAIYILPGVLVIYLVNTWLLHRFISQPIQTIRDKALQIVQDDSALGTQIREPLGRDLGELAASINTMSAALLEHTNELEQKVIERTIVLEEGSRLVQQVLDTTPNMLCLMNCEINAYNYVNREMADFFGISNDELIHAGPDYLTKRVYPSDQEIYQSHLQRISQSEDEEVVESEFRLKNDAGEWKWINFRSVVFQRNLENQPKLILYVGKDITHHKEIEEQLRFVSIHDQLTGLYNRHYFEEEMTRLEKGRLYPISIIMADIDGLKEVNDSLGHSAGDELLVRSADLLRESFRAEDVVARIGGDEFAALLPGTDQKAAEKVCERIQMIFSQPAGPDEVPVHISIGTGTAKKGRALNETLKLADQMMYADKLARRESHLKAKSDRINPG